MNWNEFNKYGSHEPDARGELPKFDNGEQLARHMMKGDPNASIPINSRVTKINSDPEDANPDGSVGTTLGSMSMPHGEAYLVMFDNQSPPGMAFVTGHKLQYLAPATHHGVYKGRPGGPPDSKLIGKVEITEELKERMRQMRGMDEVNELIMMTAHAQGMVLPPEESTIYIHKEGNYITIYLGS